MTLIKDIKHLLFKWITSPSLQILLIRTTSWNFQELHAWNIYSEAITHSIMNKHTLLLTHLLLEHEERKQVVSFTGHLNAHPPLYSPQQSNCCWDTHWYCDIRESDIMHSVSYNDSLKHTKTIAQLCNYTTIDFLSIFRSTAVTFTLLTLVLYVTAIHLSFHNIPVPAAAWRDPFRRDGPQSFCTFWRPWEQTRVSIHDVCLAPAETVSVL